MAYNLYGYMLLLITVFWVFLGSKKPALQGSANEMHSQRGSFTKEEYRNHHRDNNFAHAQEVMKHTYDNLFDVNDEQVEEICQQVRDCILEHYGGDHPLSARLANPSGGVLGKTKRLVNKKVNPETRWFGVGIIFRFVNLCLLHFDYIKDIGKGKSS